MSRTPLHALLRRALGGPERAAAPALPRAALTRRSVLAGGAAALASLAAPTRLRADAGRVAVLGAGVAGLAAALRLEAAGRSVVVYEARERVGGRVASVAAPFAPQLTLDLGGTFVNGDHADMRALAATAGVELIDVAAGRVADPRAPAEGYAFGGRIVGEAEVAAALAPLAERIARDAALLDADFARHGPEFDALSVAAYLDAALPKDADPLAAALARAAIRTEYGVEAEDASALELIWLAPQVEGAAVRLLGSSDEAYVVAGGAGSIPRSLAGLLSRPVETNAPVAALRVDGSGAEVELASGASERFDAVVVALPLPALRRVRVEADLPEGFRALLAQGRLGRNEKLFAAFRGSPWREAGVFSETLWSDGGFASAWEDPVPGPEEAPRALTFFHGGRETEDLAGVGAETLLVVKIASLRATIPGLAEAALPGAARTDWAGSPFTGGAYTSFAPGAYTRFAPHLWVEDETGAAAGPAFGRIAFAGEHLSDSSYGYMNGAAQTGRLAAEALIGG